MVMFVQIPSILNEMVHFQVLSPVHKVLIIVSDSPVIEHTLLEDETDKSLREILYSLT